MTRFLQSCAIAAIFVFASVFDASAADTPTLICPPDYTVRIDDELPDPSQFLDPAPQGREEVFARTFFKIQDTTTVVRGSCGFSNIQQLKSDAVTTLGLGGPAPIGLVDEGGCQACIVTPSCPTYTLNIFTQTWEAAKMIGSSNYKWTTEIEAEILAALETTGYWEYAGGFPNYSLVYHDAEQIHPIHSGFPSVTGCTERFGILFVDRRLPAEAPGQAYILERMWMVTGGCDTLDGATCTQRIVVEGDGYVPPSPPRDSDGDGVADPLDACPLSDLSETVSLNGKSTGVPNLVLRNGCSLNDAFSAAKAAARSQKAFGRQVRRLARKFQSLGLITGKQKGELISAVSRSDRKRDRSRRFNSEKPRGF